MLHRCAQRYNLRVQMQNKLRCAEICKRVGNHKGQLLREEGCVPVLLEQSAGRVITPLRKLLDRANSLRLPLLTSLLSARPLCYNSERPFDLPRGLLRTKLTGSLCTRNDALYTEIQCRKYRLTEESIAVFLPKVSSAHTFCMTIISEGRCVVRIKTGRSYAVDNIDVSLESRRTWFARSRRISSGKAGRSGYLVRDVRKRGNRQTRIDALIRRRTTY